MFESDTAASTGRYQMRLVGGEIRQKSHQKSVQEALDESSARGWILVNASTSYTGGGYISALYWDTSPER